MTDTAGPRFNVSTFTLADGTHPTAFYSTCGNDSFIVNATDTTGYWLGGGPGSLTLRGGAGSDVLIINANTLQANIDGGGFDIVKVNDTRGVTLNLAAAHVEEALGDIGGDTFNASGASASVFLDGAGGNDILIGGIANDAIGGGGGDDYLDGRRGNDMLRGGDGRDLIFRRRRQRRRLRRGRQRHPDRRRGFRRGRRQRDGRRRWQRPPDRNRWLHR